MKDCEYGLITDVSPVGFKGQIDICFSVDWTLHGSPYFNPATLEHCQAMIRVKK